MSGGPSKEVLDIVATIQEYFAAKGWQPLLQVKVNGLKTLSPDKLKKLLPKIAAASERLAAVTAILEAIIPGNEPSREDAQDMSDSAILRLRPQQ